MLKHFLCLATLLAGTAAAPALAGAATSGLTPDGTWVTPLKTEVTITPCRKGYCGFVSKIVVPAGVLKPGESLDGVDINKATDARNKDPRMRSRRILGLRILTLSATPDSSGAYNGEIYDAEDGNTYSGYVVMQDQGTLRLSGCVLFNVICQSQDWTRAATAPGRRQP